MSLHLNEYVSATYGCLTENKGASRNIAVEFCEEETSAVLQVAYVVTSVGAVTVLGVREYTSGRTLKWSCGCLGRSLLLL